MAADSTAARCQSEAPLLVRLEAQLVLEQERTSRPSAGEGLGMILSVRS